MDAGDITVIRQAAGMQSLSRGWHSKGLTVGLVPTMGALHKGHLDLVVEARRQCDRVVVSIFVNPTQFGPSEDFSRYPRDLEGDLAKLADIGVDAVFFPDPGEMYPSGFQTRVELTRLPAHLCGLTRLNHFAGVAQVVLKLFNICKPDVAVFGQKDFQQVRVIEQMVADLNLDIRIARHPIVREPDGLAMSSRNVYLTSEQRQAATVINRTLVDSEAWIREGEHQPAAIVKRAGQQIREAGGEVEYFNVCDPVTLDDLNRIGSESTQVLLVTAVRFGATRLIDNRLVDCVWAPQPM